MHIGVAGVGRMGSAIALRLLDAGYEVSVWNRTPGRTAALAEAGARVTQTPAELAAEADIILTILTNADAQRAVYGEPDGLLAADVSGKLVIDMSTVQPAESIALAGMVRSKDCRFVECPVGGTTGPAREGKLLGLAGGNQCDVTRARSVLDQLCRRVEHVGPVGAGASMKLAINLPLLVAYQALGEAYVLCRHLGADPKWLMELFSDTSGAPNVLKTRGPAVAEALTGGPGVAPAFDVDAIRKDLRTMLAEARSLGAHLPLAERTLAIYDEAARDGWGERDGSALPAYWPGRTKP